MVLNIGGSLGRACILAIFPSQGNGGNSATIVTDVPSIKQKLYRVLYEKIGTELILRNHKSRTDSTTAHTNHPLATGQLNKKSISPDDKYFHHRPYPALKPLHPRYCVGRYTLENISGNKSYYHSSCHQLPLMTTHTAF